MNGMNEKCISTRSSCSSCPSRSSELSICYSSVVFISLLIGFLVVLTLLLVITVIWQLFIRVPFVPTPAHIARAMIELHEWKGNEQVIDLGAGDGSLLELVKKMHPGTTVKGCEIVPTVWLLGVLRALLKRSGVRVRLGSMFTEDVSKADVLFLYLFPEVMQKLEAKLNAELKPGTVVITQTFGFAHKTPLRELRLPRLGSEVSVYLYRW